MTACAPVGLGERDEEYLAWQVEDFVKRMLENEQRQKGSIQTWMDSVHASFSPVRDWFKEELQRNRTIAQEQLDRSVQFLGTDEEAEVVLWTAHGRLLRHLPPRAVAAPLEAEPLAA